MTDFHSSLDRALEHEPRWAISHTTAFDSRDPHTDWGIGGQVLADIVDTLADRMNVPDKFPPLWEDAGYVTDEAADLRAIQARVDRDIKALAAITLTPALFKAPPKFEHPPYDIRWKVPRPFAEMPRDEWDALLAQIERPTIVEQYSRAWIRNFCPAPDLRAPICSQDIPAEGVE